MLAFIHGPALPRADYDAVPGPHGGRQRVPYHKPAMVRRQGAGRLPPARSGHAAGPRRAPGEAAQGPRGSGAGKEPPDLRRAPAGLYGPQAA